jgi:hypothetical protein
MIMKKIFVVLLCLLALQLACGTTTKVVPTLNEMQMATEVAQRLTNMPTATVFFATPTLLVRATRTPPGTATNTPLPTETASSTPLPPTPTTSETPTITSTPLASDTPQPSETFTLPPYSSPTATPSKPNYNPSIEDPHGQLGEPVFKDDMNSDKQWQIGADDYTALDILDGYLRYTGLTASVGWRMPTAPSFTNFYAEMFVTTEECKGLDYYGFTLHSPDIHNPNQAYIFAVSCDGRYSLMKWDGAVEGGHMTTLVPWTSHHIILKGRRMTNRISAWMRDGHLVLFANSKALVEIWDSSYPHGYIGIAIAAKETNYFAVQIDNVSFWDLH